MCHQHIHKHNIYCHYFNNDQICPFESQGCWFKHQESPECRYSSFCQRRLCGYKHQQKSEQERQFESCLEDHVKTVHESTKDIKCKQCNYKTDNEGALTDRVGAVHKKEKKIKRDNCNLGFQLVSEPGSHIKSVHKKWKGIGKILRCDRCCFAQVNEEVFNNHMTAAHNS